MYIPWNDIQTAMNLIAFWQLSPAFPNFLMLVLPFLFSTGPTELKQTGSKPADLKYLQRTYLVTALISAIAHVCMLITCITSHDPQISISRLLLPDVVRAQSSLSASVLHIFQVDFIFCFASSLLWSFLLLFDLRRERRLPQSLIFAGSVVALLSVVAGPGTAVALTWYWAEGLMA